MHRFCQFILLFFLLLSFSFPSAANGPVPSDSSTTTQSARYTLYPATPQSTKQNRQSSTYQTHTQSTQRHHKITHHTQAQPTKPHRRHTPLYQTQSKKRTQKASGQEIVRVHRNLPHFSAISVSDNLNVTVTGGARESVVLTGEAATVQQISTTVSNGILYVKGSRSGRNADTTIHITTDSSLSALYATNSAQITANHIQSRGLVVHMDGSSCIRIRGHNVVLMGVENNSTQNFMMSGINSRSVHLAGKGPGGFTLSGVTGNLTARLCGGMSLNAEHLKANYVYVRTEDNSLAIVTPIQALYAFAFQKSNIYYCKTPVKLVVRAEESGNVLKVP